MANTVAPAVPGDVQVEGLCKTFGEHEVGRLLSPARTAPLRKGNASPMPY